MSVTKIEKSKIAIIQLRRSIKLFNIADFISSLTLAGAANQIFADYAFRTKGYNTLDGDKHFWDSIAEMTGKNKPSKGKIIQVNNRIRNSLKHHDYNAVEIIAADFEFEAQCQIDSAIRNYWIAFDSPPKDRIISNYVNGHWA